MKKLVWLCILVAAGSAGYAAPDGPDAAPHVRVFGLEGAPNFRDIGGYATANGRHVRWGEVSLERLVEIDDDRCR